MKLLAFFIALIVVTSLFGESRASGIGGIYGQQQRNRDGRGKVIQRPISSITQKAVLKVQTTTMPSLKETTRIWHELLKKMVGIENEDGKFKHRIPLSGIG